MTPWTVQTNSLGLTWIENANGQTVCDLYHRIGNHDGCRADTAEDFFAKPDARTHARRIVEAVNASPDTPRRQESGRASDGRPDDPHNGQCPIDDVQAKYRGAA